MFFKKASLFCLLWILTQCTSTVSVKQTAFLPEPDPVIQRKSYVLSYDGRTRNANWVYEELTPASLEGHASRKNCEFMQDPKIAPEFSASRQDYRGSGFDQGHLCPAADAPSSQAAMQETFYLSNISPQYPSFNRKIWLKLEKHVRDLVLASDVVYVITGPLFLPHRKKDGKRYVQYQVIGDNNVAVPNHFFKVLKVKNGKRIETQAYIIPNQAKAQDESLEHFAVTLEKVERAAGFKIGL